MPQPTEVHPVAALFPMLAEDELTDLAASIRAEGLLMPIVLDAEGRILDGRNRLAACELAGVEPDFTDYEGDDPDGYALAVNIERRHLSKGQQAMIAARACLETRQNYREAAEAAGTSRARIGYAAVVMEWAPDLVEQVTLGALGLDAAYASATERKREANSTEARLERLQHEAPDLAAMVVEEQLTLGEAAAAARKRAEERRNERESAIRETRELFGRRTSLLSLIGTMSSKDPDWPVTADLLKALREILDLVEEKMQ